MSSGDGKEYLVTAIVSTYNASRFLRGCLDDLENQTIADKLEIIVVDSGSQEDEGKIVAEYRELYDNIRYIRTERETVYAAWNRGIKVARGKYLTNANTDDRHRVDALEVLAQSLDQHPDVVLVYGDVLVTEKPNETFEKNTTVGKIPYSDYSRKMLLDGYCLMGPQPMWRASVHDEYGYFDGDMVTSGDYEFWIRITQTHDCLHVPAVLGLYMERPDSVEHSNRKAQHEENEKLLKTYRRAAAEDRVINLYPKPNDAVIHRLKDRPVNLAIGIPLTFPFVPSGFFYSFIHMERPDYVLVHADNGPIDWLRNDLVSKALELDATHLIMMDTDMLYHPQTIPRLLSHRLPVVGALSYRRYPPFDPIMLKGKPGTYEGIHEWKEGELVEVAATGCGCLMFDMQVFQNMPKPWFKFGKMEGTDETIGEDIGFCSDLKAAGYRIFVDTTIPSAHLTQLAVNHQTFKLYRSMKEKEHRIAMNEALLGEVVNI